MGNADLFHAVKCAEPTAGTAGQITIFIQRKSLPLFFLYSVCFCHIFLRSICLFFLVQISQFIWYSAKMCQFITVQGITECPRKMTEFIQNEGFIFIWKHIFFLYIFLYITFVVYFLIIYKFNTTLHIFQRIFSVKNHTADSKR